MASRSNKPLTQFACNHLANCITGTSSSYAEQRGNTKVVCKKDDTQNVFQVFLCDQLIFGMTTVNLTKNANKIVSIECGIGQALDSAGNPRKTTIERLNGLLDRLSDFRLVPEKVRVFYHPEERCYAIGKGDDYITLGAHRSAGVVLRPNSSYFEPVMRIERLQHV